MKLDYDDFLRQRGFVQWERENPLRQELIDRRFQCADDVARWVAEVGKRIVASGPCGLTGRDKKSDPRETKSTLSTKVYPEIAANAVLVLLAVACTLLDRQVSRLAEDFENQGGFSERLYRVRSRKRGF